MEVPTAPVCPRITASGVLTRLCSGTAQYGAGQVQWAGAGLREETEPKRKIPAEEKRLRSGTRRARNPTQPALYHRVRQRKIRRFSLAHKFDTTPNSGFTVFCQTGTEHFPKERKQTFEERVGKGRLELPRFSAHDPKSCSSTYFDTSPLQSGALHRHQASGQARRSP